MGGTRWEKLDLALAGRAVLVPPEVTQSMGSMVGLMVISSKRAYAIGRVTQVAAPRAPVPATGHC